jgi:1-acyl-sn-glycerol-3-phosphate acyltransferase
MAAHTHSEMNWIWIIGAPLVRAIMAVCFRMRVEGIDHVPAAGPVVLAPNHISVLDGPGVSAITGTHRWRATRNLIAAEVFHGVIGWIVRQARQIPLRRGSRDTSALDDAIEALRRGSCVGIFPEGSVNGDAYNGLQRIRSGLTRIALPTGAPVVPVGIWGTHTAWPKQGLDARTLLRRPSVAVIYGEPLISAPDESPTEFRERFHAALQRLVDRARSLAGDLPDIAEP